MNKIIIRASKTHEGKRPHPSFGFAKTISHVLIARSRVAHRDRKVPVLRPSCPTNYAPFSFSVSFLVGAQTDEKANRQSNLFDDAKEKGLLISDASGAPYMIPNTSFEAAMMDLTNPETRQWIKGLMYKMAKTGVRGWMADFGESLPFDSCLHSGKRFSLRTHT